ncbi:hypothetical protein GLOIN_2v1729495 [Rhizophagus irregularis DAOM 181602=DAOM 197198]|nr:hypothetical protein GLOIN_2v1729495 [Rhizophagus irregularis DAOM 181602=DAOM 197198]
MSSYSSLSRVLSPFRVQTKFEENSLPASPALNPKRYTEIMLEQPPSEHIHILVQLPTPATTVGPSHQGVPQVTSIEDAMKKILEGIHKQMDTNYRILLMRWGTWHRKDTLWNEYEIQGDIKIASEIILGLRLSNVLLYIHNLEHESLIQRGKHLFIFLQIDEFQLIFKERNGGEKLFKQLMYTLGHHMAGEIPEVFVQTLLSGTAPQDAIRAMEPTMYSIEPLDLPLLSLESRLEIMREFATNHGVSDCVWVPKVWIHQLLLDTGGLPRALEYLFAEFFGQRFYKEILWKIESDISDVLQDGDHRIKLEHLERDRHLILRRSEEEDKVQIDIPYFFMYHYASVLGVFTEHLNHAFLPDEIWSWQNWEKFIADFITSRINMIDVLNKEKLLKLGNFFRGSGSNVTLGQLINFGSVEIYELNHQFPCLNLSAKKGKTAVLKPGYIMINGYSAPFADIFFLVDEPDPILIAIQCRLRKNLLNLKTIEDEHKRNANISHKMEEKARKLKNDSKIASREKKEELRKEAEKYTQLGNLLKKFDTFFGPVFSSRTKFVMTRDSNPNLSTASQLTSRYKAISQDIGERIEQTRKRRIFRSHEEFCEEFKELADVNELRDDFIYYPYPPYIEPFEHSNKRTRV